MDNNFLLINKKSEEKSLKRPRSSSATRKHLPSVPPMDETSPFRPFFLEYSLTNEYNLLIKQKLSSVLIMPSSKQSTIWNGVIFVRQGIYQGGVFRFKILIPNNFPDSACPELVFCPPVYHPIIHPTTGTLDVSRAFHSWKQNYHHIWQVVQYAKRIFIKIETDQPFNHEASTLYNEDLNLFKRKVERSIELSNEILYEDPDPEDYLAIRFNKLDEQQYEKIKSEIINMKEDIREVETPTNKQGSQSWCAEENRAIDENICDNNSSL